MLGADLHIPDKTLVEAKESVIFALLAHERIQGRPNVIGSTTGSGIWHSSGSVFAP